MCVWKSEDLCRSCLSFLPRSAGLGQSFFSHWNNSLPFQFSSEASRRKCSVGVHINLWVLINSWDLHMYENEQGIEQEEEAFNRTFWGSVIVVEQSGHHAHVFNPSTQEAKADGWLSFRQSLLHSEILSKYNKIVLGQDDHNS